MDIQGKTVLVIGGWGLVGSAVCRKFMEENPKRIVVTSLARPEAEEAVAALQKDYPHGGKDFFIPWWGNIFVREQLKDLPREAILSNHAYRVMLIEDMIEELTGPVLKRSALYRLMQRYRPDIVVDCVNSATAIAYQDLFQVSREVLREVNRGRGRKTSQRQAQTEQLLEKTERLLCTLYVPQLIRHVQIMYRSMQEADTKIYVKIGTSGTGGHGPQYPLHPQ